MIPDFNDNGLLPAGEHKATLEEFRQRFAVNKKRIEIFEGILKLIADLKSIGCNVIWIDGSYVTSKSRPGDADICWELLPGDDFLNYARRNVPLLFELKAPRARQQATYKSDVFPAHVPANNKGTAYLKFFQEDKQSGEPKGIIRIELL